jgi:hypothetical protein
MTPAGRGKQARRLSGVLLVVGQSMILWLTGASVTQDAYEAYYWFLGDYPASASPGWNDGANGLTHDRDNWFITQTPTTAVRPEGPPRLWKIPVTHDLNKVKCDDPGVACQQFDDWPRLSAESYHHLGDPDYFEFEGQGYVLVPLEGGAKPAIGFFRATDLKYVNHAYLTGKADAPWCAVDSQGAIYVSQFDEVSPLYKYNLDWKPFLGRSSPMDLPAPELVSLTDADGSSLRVHDVQGGVISPSGQLLYITAGWPPHNGDSSHGIHVIDLISRKRIQCSANPNDSGGRRDQCSSVAAGLFNFQFDEGTVASQEPEGLTIWDLDDGRAGSKIRGQLHVLLLDKNLTVEDAVYLKHYEGVIHVDGAYSGDQVGTPQQPMKTLARAHEAAWSGATIKVRPGAYPEKVTLTKRVQVVSSGGTASIGK